MALLCDPIVSAAITGIPLEVGAKAFESASQNSDRVTALEAQIATLTALWTAKVETPVVEPTTKTK